MNANISFILLTYDGASFLWNNYFKLVDKYWENFWNIFSDYYMTTESISFRVSEARKIKSFFIKSENLSDRLIGTLENIKSEFVFIDIDDFWLKEHVNDCKFKNAVAILKENKRIDSIGFENFRKSVKKRGFDEDFNILKKRMFIFNLQKGLWRRDSLLKVLRHNENPWKMEYYGSVRAVLLGMNVLTEKPSEFPTFSYDYGWLVVRGKFDKKVFNYFVENEGVDANLANKIGFRERGQNKKVKFMYKMKHLMLALLSFFKR